MRPYLAAHSAQPRHRAIGLLNIVDERCGGTLDNIDDVIPPGERAEFMAGYKAAAGFAVEKLNKAPPTIAHGARARAARGISLSVPT